MKELVEAVVKALVNEPDNVQIKEIDGENSTVLEIQVAAEDVGRVIGKQGKVIKAIRLLTNASAIKQNKRVTVEIIG